MIPPGQYGKELWRCMKCGLIFPGEKPRRKCSCGVRLWYPAEPVAELLQIVIEDERRRAAEIARGLTRVDNRLEAGYECGWNAACAAAADAILSEEPKGA